MPIAPATLIRSVSRVAACLVTSSVVLVGCSVGDDKKQDPTPTTIAVQNQESGTKVETRTLEVATPVDDATLAVERSQATPHTGASPAASPIASPASRRSEATPASGPTAAVRAMATPSANGDGTGGPEYRGQSDQSMSIRRQATPNASPAASPSAAGCRVTDVPAFSGGTTVQYAIEDVNFRSGPGADCAPLTDSPITAGETVEVIGGPVQDANGVSWYQVRYGDQTGWIAAEFLAPSE